MRSLLLVFANICLLRRGPELVPTRPWFVATVLVADLIVSYVVSRHLGGAQPARMVVTTLVVSMATTASITWLLLSLRGVEARFTATITAMFGCDLLLTALIGCAASAALAAAGATAANGVVTVIGIWSIAVNGFILHRAIAVAPLVGVGIAFAIALFAFALAGIAVGPPPP